jgi:hypothetical protein
MGVESPEASTEISARLKSLDCRALVGVTGSTDSLAVPSSSSSGMGSWQQSIDRVSGELGIDVSWTSSSGGVGGGSKAKGGLNDIFALAKFQFTDSSGPTEDEERGGVFM